MQAIQALLTVAVTLFGFEGAAQYAPLAQLVEHLTLNQGVQGSSPWRRTQRYRFYGRMSHRVGAFLLYHEALLHDQQSSFAECINAFFSLALIISRARADALYRLLRRLLVL